MAEFCGCLRLIEEVCQLVCVLVFCLGGKPSFFFKRCQHIRYPKRPLDPLRHRANLDTLRRCESEGFWVARICNREDATCTLKMMALKKVIYINLHLNYITSCSPTPCKQWKKSHDSFHKVDLFLSPSLSTCDMAMSDILWWGGKHPGLVDIRKEAQELGVSKTPS